MKNSNEFSVMGNANFVALCQLTLAVSDRDAFPNGTFSNDGDPWLELVIAWEKLLEGGSAGIFMDAVHRIMWNIPPTRRKSNYEEIVQIVVDELLKDDDAFHAWDSYDPCDMAIEMLGSEMRPWVPNDEDYSWSIEHYQYAEAKMLWKIRYSKEKYRKEYFDYQNDWLLYESAIKKIVPSAESWTDEYWLKESHIHDELIRRYGIDYRDDYVEYGRVLLLLMNEETDAEKRAFDEAWFASTIKRMPMALAKVIWPENTEEKIMQIFLLASELTAALAESGLDFQKKKEQEIHPIGVFEYSTLRESWIYQLMAEWFQDEDSANELVHDVKKRLFTIGLRG